MQLNIVLLTLLSAAGATALNATVERCPPNSPCGCDVEPPSCTNTPNPPGSQYCNTNQISTMNVGSCTCRPQQNACGPTPCPACGYTPQKDIRFCDGGCTDVEGDCAACGLWFHTLCNCLQHPAGCPNSGTIQRNGKPVWVLLNHTASAETLVTTNELLPGILEMGRQPLAFHNQGWTFAQQKYKPAFQALALNSYRSRKHEQVHIHLCQRKGDTVGLLTKETPKSTKHLVRLENDPEMHCLGLAQGQPVDNLATAVAEFIREHEKTVCKEIVGAGIMHDGKGRTWGCATTNSDGPLAKFCQ